MNSSFIIHKSSFYSLPWLGIILAWGVAFCIACHLTVTPVDIEDPEKQSTIAGKVFGDSQLALSKFFFFKADQYFHKGVPYIKPKAFRDSIFQKTVREIIPEDHVHIHGRNVREIMPWLWLAIQADPHNVEVCLVAAFWLAKDIDRLDIAIEVLREAQFNNPYNYEIPLAQGRIYLEEKRLEEAKKTFDAGLAFWPGNQDPDSEYAKYDKRELLLYKALLHEADGDNENAIRAMETILEMFPEQTGWRDRIETLKKGDEPALLPSDFWKDMLEKHRESQETCPREHEHGHEHQHEHEQEH